MPAAQRQDVTSGRSAAARLRQRQQHELQAAMDREERLAVLDRRRSCRSSWRRGRGGGARRSRDRWRSPTAGRARAGRRAGPATAPARRTSDTGWRGRRPAADRSRCRARTASARDPAPAPALARGGIPASPRSISHGGLPITASKPGRASGAPSAPWKTSGNSSSQWKNRSRVARRPGRRRAAPVTVARRGSVAPSAHVDPAAPRTCRGSLRAHAVVEPAGAPQVGDRLPPRQRCAGRLESRRTAVPSREPVRSCLRARRAASSRDVTAAPTIALERQRRRTAAADAEAAAPARASLPDVGDAGADQAVAGAQVMIEERQRTVARQRGQPQRQPRQLHRHRIEVHAEQAALRDDPAEPGALAPPTCRCRRPTPSRTSAAS